jgi:hypothetical protein
MRRLLVVGCCSSGDDHMQKNKTWVLEDRVSKLEDELEEAKYEGEKLQDHLDNDALVSDDGDYEEDPEE